MHDMNIDIRREWPPVGEAATRGAVGDAEASVASVLCLHTDWATAALYHQLQLQKPRYLLLEHMTNWYLWRVNAFIEDEDTIADRRLSDSFVVHL